MRVLLLLGASTWAVVLACRPSPPVVEVQEADDAEASLSKALARIDDIDKGLPRVEDGFVWWGSRDEDGRTAHLRRAAEPGAPVEVVLDEKQELPAPFVDVGSLSSSPDRKKVAFSADTTRTDRYGVHVKDLKSGQIERVVDDADFSVSWSPDGSLYFTRFGGDDRPRSLWRVQPESNPTPTLVHELADHEGGELIVADVDGAPELFVRPADAAEGVTAFRLVVDGEAGGSLRAVRRPSRAAVR